MPSNTQVFVAMHLDEFTQLIRDIVKSELSQFTSKEPYTEELLTVDETAKFLKTSDVTVHKWKKRGLIQSYRIGRRIFFKKAELVASMKTGLTRKAKEKLI